MTSLVDLDSLSALIENETHATHAINGQLWLKIKSTVESVPHIKEPLNVRDKRITSVLNLNPFSFKLFQYFVATLENVLPEATTKTIYHVSQVVLIKSFKYFPNNTEIFIAYAIRRILNDRDAFLRECFDDKILNAKNKSTLAGNVLGWLMLVLLVGVIVSVSITIKKQMMNNDGKLFSNKQNEKSEKKRLKQKYKDELKAMKEKIKSKYGVR